MMGDVRDDGMDGVTDDVTKGAAMHGAPGLAAPGLAAPSVGTPMDRVDGRLKVTGGARYTAEMPVPNVAYAVMVTSTIPSGRVRAVDIAAAEKAPGVLAVLTPANAPRLPAPPRPAGGQPAPPAQRVPSLLQDD
ncbi:MAG: hypothetical protein WKG32_13830, partial [Gemmatimonadaceae bacterium]